MRIYRIMVDIFKDSSLEADNLKDNLYTEDDLEIQPIEEESKRGF